MCLNKVEPKYQMHNSMVYCLSIGTEFLVARVTFRWSRTASSCIFKPFVFEAYYGCITSNTSTKNKKVTNFSFSIHYT